MVRQMGPKSQRHQHKLWKQGSKSASMNKEKEFLLNSLGLEWRRLPDGSSPSTMKGQKNKRKKPKRKHARGQKRKEMN